MRGISQIKVKIYNRLFTLPICRDYDEFMDDLEEDREYRQTINIYKKPDIMPVDVDDMDDPNEPYITLEEMLDDLNIDENEMAS